MTGHARLSPSGADRWMVCTASVPLIESLIAKGDLKDSDLEDDRTERISEEEIIEQALDAYGDAVLDPNRESTSFSAEGTAMHEIRAECLYWGTDPFDYVGQTVSADGYTFEIDDDMADRLVAGIDWINSLTSNARIEEIVPLDEWLPGNYGFCDTFWLYGGDLYVSDYKNGVGESVDVFKTRQLRLYALGAWAKLGKPKIKKVILNIDQPRAGGMKFWEITLSELLEFADEVQRVYSRIESGQVEFAPSSKGCRWCPVKNTKRGCAAYNQWHLWMLGYAAMDPSNPEPKFSDPSQMSRALRFYLVQHAPSIRQWLAKLHEESLNAALDGDPDPGSKAVKTGEGRRYFVDEEKAAEIIESVLGEKAFNKRLIGFTEVDKLMKPGRKKPGFPNQYGKLLELTDRKDPKPKLVSADHPAAAYTNDLHEEFEDYGDDEFEDYGDL